MEKKCNLCHSRLANKTNSHLIPSFFFSMVSSVDNSYSRDKELLYTIGDHSTRTYIGRGVKEEDLKNSFDSLTDDRIKEMTKSTVSMDYILCSHCEKKLGEYLESPWHDFLFRGRNVSPNTAYFFWVSVLWRISVFEGKAFKLPAHIEKTLGKQLNSFIQARDNKDDITPLLNNSPFVYKILYCRDYSKKHAGMIYYEYDRKSKIATFLLGDVAVCFSFHTHGSFEKHSFYGLEKAFTTAPINDGSRRESVLNINAKELEAFNDIFIPQYQAKRLDGDRENIIKMWNLVRDYFQLPLPSEPSDCFVKYVASELYDDSVKTGERTTRDYFVKCFRKGLQLFYINSY